MQLFQANVCILIFVPHCNGILNLVTFSDDIKNKVNKN